MLDKQSRNLCTNGIITRTMVVNIKSMAHVCSNTFLSIFLRRETIVFWKMSLLHWLTKLTHQTLYREKTIGEVLWRQWRHGDWTLKTVSEIAFCFILTNGFERIVIKTWFTKMIFIPIIIVFTFITIVAVGVFITLFFHCCCRFHYSFVFIVAISVIVLVFFLSLLVLVWLSPLLL